MTLIKASSFCDICGAITTTEDICWHCKENIEKDLRSQIEKLVEVEGEEARKMFKIEKILKVKVEFYYE